MLRVAVLSQCLLFIDGCTNNTGNTPAGPLSLSRFSDGEFVLFRLNGDRYPGEAKPEGAELLHGREIVQSVQIATPHDRAKIFRAFETGKCADFVELSADPFEVDVNKLTSLVQVQGTWRGGRRINLDAFLDQVKAINPATHAKLAEKAAGRHVCSHGGHGCEH